MLWMYNIFNSSLSNRIRASLPVCYAWKSTSIDYVTTWFRPKQDWNMKMAPIPNRFGVRQKGKQFSEDVISRFCELGHESWRHYGMRSAASWKRHFDEICCRFTISTRFMPNWMYRNNILSLAVTVHLVMLSGSIRLRPPTGEHPPVQGSRGGSGRTRVDRCGGGIRGGGATRWWSAETVNAGVAAKRSTVRRKAGARGEN